MTAPGIPGKQTLVIPEKRALIILEKRARETPANRTSTAACSLR